MPSCDPILCRTTINALVLLYNLLFHNLGLAIIGITMILRLALAPSMKSLLKMRELAPELERLKRKHGKDQKKFLQAQSDFYKQKGINPAAGCLPQILQFLLLIGLFGALSLLLKADLTYINSTLIVPLKLSDTSTINTKFLYLDLAKPDTIGAISLSGKNISIPGPLLILTMLVQLLSSKMMMPAVQAAQKKAAKTKGQADDIMASFQQQSLYLFPLMTLIIGLGFPSGLVLYWFTFSAFQVVYQVRVSGWGGAAPWIKILGLLKLPPSK